MKYCTTIRELLKKHLGSYWRWELPDPVIGAVNAYVPIGQSLRVGRSRFKAIQDRLVRHGWKVIGVGQYATDMERIYRGKRARIRVGHIPSGSGNLITPHSHYTELLPEVEDPYGTDYGFGPPRASTGS